MTTRIPRRDYVREKLQSQTMKKDVIIYKASDELAKKLTDRMEKKAEEGGAVSKPALGYKMFNKELIIDPEKAGAVKQIFNEYLERQKNGVRGYKTIKIGVIEDCYHSGRVEYVSKGSDIEGYY